MNLDNKKRADPKPRSDFKNVAKDLPGFNNYLYRPVIEQAERLLKLSNDIKINPNIVVNFLVDVGIECFERSIPVLKDEIKKTVNSKISKLLK